MALAAAVTPGPRGSLGDSTTKRSEGFASAKHRSSAARPSEMSVKTRTPPATSARPSASRIGGDRNREAASSFPRPRVPRDKK